MLPHLLENQITSRYSKQLDRSLQVYIIFLHMRKRTDSERHRSFYRCSLRGSQFTPAGKRRYTRGSISLLEQISLSHVNALWWKSGINRFAMLLHLLAIKWVSRIANTSFSRRLPSRFLPSRLQSSGRGSLPGIFVRKVLHNYSKLSFPGVILNGETDAENLRIFPPLLKYRITEQAEMPVNPGFPLLPRYRNRRSRNE